MYAAVLHTCFLYGFVYMSVEDKNPEIDDLLTR